MRYCRQACKFNFRIVTRVYNAIKNNVDRLDIISKERIVEEVNKILLCKQPSRGLALLHDTGLMRKFLPELSIMDFIEEKDGMKHKNNFHHTLQVVDQVRALTDDLTTLWAALLHDIGKPKTKAFKDGGWTFHNHEDVGAKMVIPLMNRLKLPTQEWGDKIVCITKYHGKVKELALDETSDVKISDSAIRRLVFETDKYLDDLLLFVRCDITTKFGPKRQKYLEQYDFLEKRIKEIEEKDHIRNFKLPISGEEIMEIFCLKPSKAVGLIKEDIKNAIFDGKIGNNEPEARKYMMENAHRFIHKVIASQN
jgi:putative nucleotidyltransferase with HDIG domain